MSELSNPGHENLRQLAFKKSKHEFVTALTTSLTASACGAPSVTSRHHDRPTLGEVLRQTATTRCDATQFVSTSNFHSASKLSIVKFPFKPRARSEHLKTTAPFSVRDRSTPSTVMYLQRKIQIYTQNT